MCLSIVAALDTEYACMVIVPSGEFAALFARGLSG